MSKLYYEVFKPVSTQPIYFYVFKDTDSIMQPDFIKNDCHVFMVSVEGQEEIIDLAQFMDILQDMYAFEKCYFDDFIHNDIRFESHPKVYGVYINSDAEEPIYDGPIFNFFNISLNPMEVHKIIQFFKVMQKRIVSNFNDWVSVMQDLQNDDKVLPFARDFSEFIKPNTVIETGSKVNLDAIVNKKNI